MHGKCLCREIVFELTGPISNIYQCHCSLSQKAVGTTGSSAFITKVENIEWLKGRDKIKSYCSHSGFRTDLCSNCGSSLPLIMNIAEFLWVHAGIIDENLKKQTKAHIVNESKPSWAIDAEDCQNHVTGPENKLQAAKLFQSLE